MGLDKLLDKDEEMEDTSETDVQEEAVEELEREFLVEDSQMIATEPIKNSPPKKYMTRIVKPGWGSSGYYSENVLKQAIEDGVFHFGMHSYIDHPTKSERRERTVRSVRDQLGFIGEDAVYNEDGSEGPGVYAPLSVFPDRRSFVKDRTKSTGLSMHVLCEYRKGRVDGKYGNVVERMIKEDTNSVDMVSVAGAGGKFGAILESKSDIESEETMSKDAQVQSGTQAEGTTTETETSQGGDEMSTENEFDFSQLDSTIAHEMYESKRKSRIREEKMAGELRDLKVSAICHNELARQSLMEVTRNHLFEVLPEQIKRSPECFTEDGILDDGKAREYITESVDHHLRYLEALDRERTHGVQRFQVVEEGSRKAPARSQNAFEQAFMGLGYTAEQAEKAFGTN